MHPALELASLLSFSLGIETQRYVNYPLQVLHSKKIIDHRAESNLITALRISSGSLHGTK